MFHFCGDIRLLIPDFIEAGLGILNPVQISCLRKNLKELEGEFGRDLIFREGNAIHSAFYRVPAPSRHRLPVIATIYNKRIGYIF